jgi:hypothetical protein
MRPVDVHEPGDVTMSRALSFVRLSVGVVFAILSTAAATFAADDTKKPSILVIFRDDVGITSNTFRDWQLNHVGQVYGAMDDVGKFVATFKDFPPRSFPPSFVPTTIMEQTLDQLREQPSEAQEKAGQTPN